MPIRESQKARYPDNWPEIRERIKARAGNRCEGCGVENLIYGYRSGDTFIQVATATGTALRNASDHSIIRIVCTVAHLDHTPENCADDNLRFWCQKCHNGYDAKHRAAGRRERAMHAEKQADRSSS